MDHDAKNDIIYHMQERLDRLEHDYENLIEQIRLANQQRFGRHTEKLDGIAGQLSFFNEAEACCDAQSPEPSIDEVAGGALNFKTQILLSRRRHAALCALENILFAGKQPGYP